MQVPYETEPGQVPRKIAIERLVVKVIFRIYFNDRVELVLG